MKKSIAVLITLAALLAFSGCTDVKTDSVSDKQTLSTETLKDTSDGTEETETNTEQNKAVEKSESPTESSPEQETTENRSEQDLDAQSDSESENTVSEDDIQNIGEELFEKACKTTWTYLCGVPYELDYEDSYENAFRVIGVDSFSDILEDYNKVFTGEHPELEEKYISTQYALYCYDGGRGENIYYQDTELELVSLEGDTVVFNAVSHYADPETNEPLEDRTDSFVIVNIDGEWRVSEFRLPY